MVGLYDFPRMAAHREIVQTRRTATSPSPPPIACGMRKQLGRRTLSARAENNNAQQPGKSCAVLALFA
jgi:hypothetical protein